MKLFYFHILIVACLVFPVSSWADPRNEENLDQIATSLFGNPPQGMVLPKQVETALPIATFFMTQKAINSFPFGLAQAQFASGQGIKSTTLDAYLLDPDGHPRPEIAFRIFVDFDQSGNVTRLSRTGSSIYEYIYRDGVLSSIVIDGTPTFSWDQEGGVFSEVSNPNSTTVTIGADGRVEEVLWNYDGRVARFGPDEFVPLPVDQGARICTGPRSSNSCYEIENGHPTQFFRAETFVVNNGNHMRRENLFRIGWANDILENVVGLGENKPQLILWGAGIITRDDMLTEIILLERLRSTIDVSYSRNFSPINGIFEVLPSREDMPKFRLSRYASRSHLVVLNPTFTEYYP